MLGSGNHLPVLRWGADPAGGFHGENGENAMALDVRAALLVATMLATVLAAFGIW
jgi:hypothetical protein